MRYVVCVLALVTACSDAGVTKHNTPPTAELTSHIDGDAVRDGYPVQLRGVVGDPNHPITSLSVSWLVDAVEVCPESVPSSDGVVECELIFDATGTGTVVLEVRDPDGGAAEARVTLTVTPTDAPMVSITAPDGTDRLYEGRSLRLAGTVEDGEDLPTDLMVTWETVETGLLDVDVEVSEDGSVASLARLDAGTYDLKLRAVDTTGKEGVDSLNIEVVGENEPPSCSLTSPVDGSTVGSGVPTRLEGMASDSHQPATELAVTFESDADGLLGTPSPDSDGTVWMTTDTLSPTTHRITLTVTDELGEVCSDSIALTVGNAPTVTIDAPAIGTVVDVGTELNFAATGGDSEDAPTALVGTWSSSADGTLWTGALDGAGQFGVDTDALTAGTHTLTASVTDTDGMSASATVDVRINALPVIIDVAITPDPAWNDSTLACTATATDAEGAAPALSYAWTNRSTGAPLGTGSTITLSSSVAAVGDLIACEATAIDTDGATASGSATRSLSNRAPAASVTLAPTSGVRTNDTLTATVTATDADDDALTTTYAWSVGGTVVTTTSSNTLDGATWFHKNELVAVTATVDDGTDTTTASSASVAIDNTPPGAPTLTITPTEPAPGDDLLCTVLSDSADDDLDTISYTMSWTVDGVPYAAGGSTDTGGLDSGDPGWLGPLTTTWPDDTVDGDDLQYGETWTCTATPDDGDDLGADARTSVDVIACAGAQTFAYTGAAQTWTVPTCVSEITIEAWGASGGNAVVGFGMGGLGGYATGTLTVAPGDTFFVYVGGVGDDHGTGGFNGGGDAGIEDSAGGGGASDVRISTSLSDRIIVAAGGGGSGYESAWSSGWAVGSGTCNGGDGGGTVGSDGGSWQYPCQGGTGGTQSSGGTSNGTLGQGGSPRASAFGDMAGGGGGYYGGGAGGDCTGYNGCGGGGSSYLGGVSSGATTSGVNSGDGAITIRWE